METMTSIKPLLAVLVSLAAVIPITAFGKNPNLREASTFLAGIIKFSLVVSMVPFILDGGTIEFSIAEVLPGLAIMLKVDAMGMLFALVSSTLWIVTSAISPFLPWRSPPPSAWPFPPTFLPCTFSTRCCRLPPIPW